MASIEQSTTCRACGHGTEPFLAFGELPLANALVPVGTTDESRFPLTMTSCSNCGLVQLAESVDPDRLFRHYFYLSSNSPAFLEHAKLSTQGLIKDRALGPASRVIEIASNDGYLLQNYRNAGIPVLGIEPARNIAELARQRGIETISEFFSADLAATLRADGKLADVIHANNVLAHVPDLRGFVAGFATVLKPAGVVVIEVPYVRDMIEKLEFDTAYHEHLCYFSLTPLVTLFARNGLDIFRVERIPVHGGSLRIFAQHAGGGPPEAPVTQMLDDERQWGVCDPALLPPLRRRGPCVPADFSGIPRQAARRRQVDRRLWRLGQGRDHAELLRRRSPHAEFCRRSQRHQTGLRDARRAAADLGAGRAAAPPTGFCASSDVELH